MIALTRKIWERIARSTGGSMSPRPTVRQALACESLEGRQLLNGSWGHGGLVGGVSASGLTPAEIQSLHGGAGQRNGFAFGGLGKGGHALAHKLRPT